MWMAEALWTIQVSPWVRVADASDEVLRDAVAAARRLMQESLATGRPGRQVYRRAGRPCLRCGTIVRSRGQGDDNRTAYWCPGVSGRSGTAGGVSRTDGGTRSAPSPHPPLLLSGRLRLPRPCARGRRRPAVRLRGARPAGRAGAVRVPAARADVRRVAGECARGPGGRADRARRAAARAGRRDLRARARRPETVRGAGALPHRAALAADLDRRVVRRLRLGRHLLRARLRRARDARSSAPRARTPLLRRSSGSRS